MAQSITRKLDAGSAFPEIRLNLLDNGATTVKAALAGSWSVALFYRGHW